MCVCLTHHPRQSMGERGGGKGRVCRELWGCLPNRARDSQPLLISIANKSIPGVRHRNYHTPAPRRPSSETDPAPFRRSRTMVTHPWPRGRAMTKWLTSEVTQPTRPSYYVPLTRGSREVDLARVRTGQVRCQGCGVVGGYKAGGAMPLLRPTHFLLPHAGRERNPDRARVRHMLALFGVWVPL
jgi:hypothetical protein